MKCPKCGEGEVLAHYTIVTSAYVPLKENGDEDVDRMEVDLQGFEFDFLHSIFCRKCGAEWDSWEELEKDINGGGWRG